MLYCVDKPREAVVTELNTPGMLLSKLLMICASRAAFEATAEMTWRYLTHCGLRWDTELFNYLVLSGLGMKLPPNHRKPQGR